MTRRAHPPFSSLFMTLGIILAAVGLSSLSFLLPVTGTANVVAVHSRAAIGMMVAPIFLGTAGMFLSGLGGFQAKLRTAYRLFSLGFLLLSVALLQLVVWGLFELWDSVWVTSGIGMVPYAIPAVLVYLGIRKIAQALSLRSRLASVWLVSAIALVVGGLAYITATQWVQYELAGVEAYIAICLWASTYVLCGALLMRRVYRAIGQYYQPAMKWLAVSMAVLFAAYAHEGITTFLYTNGDAYVDYGWYLLPIVVAGLVQLRAAYQFSLLPLPGHTPATAPAPVGPVQTQDYIDSLVNVAGLVSRREDISDALEQISTVTAKQRQSEPVTAKDERHLLQTYWRLEQYLLGDAVRVFDKTQIRSYVTPGFLQVLQQHEH